MDQADKSIVDNELASQIGGAVRDWLNKNDISEDVIATASVSMPTLYVDDKGRSHTGKLIIVNIDYPDDDFEEE